MGEREVGGGVWDTLRVGDSGGVPPLPISSGGVPGTPMRGGGTPMTGAVAPMRAGPPIRGGGPPTWCWLGEERRDSFRIIVE